MPKQEVIGGETFAGRFRSQSYPALERVGTEVGHHQKAAVVAHVGVVGIGDLEETLPEELRRTVRDLAITLHFAEAKASVASASLHGLTVHHLNRSAGARVDFVVHHMFQALVVGRSEEHLNTTSVLEL